MLRTMFSTWDKRVKICLIFCLIWVTTCRSEYYSSIDAIQQLAHVEKQLLLAYRQQLDRQRVEFAHYRNLIAQVKAQHALAAEDVKNYLGNTFNVYKLMKRVSVDWAQMKEGVKQQMGLKQLNATVEQLRAAAQFPNERDLNGAANGIARLQEIYELNVPDLMAGVINGTAYGATLTWRHAYTLGSSLYEEKNYAQAIDWLEQALEALERHADDDFAHTSTDTQHSYHSTLEHLALAHYNLGAFRPARRYMDELLERVPMHSIKELDTLVRDGQPTPVKLEDRRERIDWYANYTRLCRGIRVPEARRVNLKCRISTKNRPYFTLAPLKIEELSLEPEIALHHGIVSDEIIERILAEARQIGLFRSTFEYKVNDTRISQQAWLYYTNSLMRLIYNLVSDVSGLDLRNAEPMQVANYGIGGQFEAHCDTLGYAPSWLIGDRLATVMFYFSDVEQGGYTIFPNLNMYVRPVKGALLMWYNMHRSLDDDNRSMHAGCPLMKGTKRIGNIWIHTGLQEFKRPCALERDNYKSFGYTCNE